MVEHGETERVHRQLVAEVRLITVVTGLGACGLPAVSTHAPCTGSRIIGQRCERPNRSDSVDEQLRATYSKLFAVAGSGRTPLGHITAFSAVAGVPDAHPARPRHAGHARPRPGEEVTHKGTGLCHPVCPMRKMRAALSPGPPDPREAQGGGQGPASSPLQTGHPFRTSLYVQKAAQSPVKNPRQETLRAL